MSRFTSSCIVISVLFAQMASTSAASAQSYPPRKIFDYCLNLERVSDDAKYAEMDRCMLGSRFKWNGTCDKTKPRELKCYSKDGIL